MTDTSTSKIYDQEAFQKQLPHQLIPTNLEGAFTTGAPPKEFDPNTASAASLVKHGLFLTNR